MGLQAVLRHQTETRTLLMKSRLLGADLIASLLDGK